VRIRTFGLFPKGVLSSVPRMTTSFGAVMDPSFRIRSFFVPGTRNP
jgi:hypothetical protein